MSPAQRWAWLESGSGRTTVLASWPSFWRLAAADRRMLLRSLGTGVLCLVAAALLFNWQDARLRAAQQKQDSVSSARIVLAREASASTPAPAPWWNLLHLHGARRDGRSTAEQLQADALSVSKELNILVLRVGLQPPAPSQTDGPPFAATSLQVELRGSYADIKTWLAELLSRRPGALAIKSIDLRRAADPSVSTLEASIELRLFERTR